MKIVRRDEDLTVARKMRTLARRGGIGAGTSGSTLRVSEEDASPLVENVIELEFPNDKVTDMGSGKVHIDVSGDGLSYISEVTGTPITGIVGIVVSDDTLTDLGSGVVQIDLRRVLSMAEPGDVPRVYPVTEIRVPDGTLTDLGDGNVELAIVASATTVTAGAGLTGGGALSANITIDVAAADTSMTINADSIQVRLATNSGMQVSSGLQLGTPSTVTSTSTNAVTTTTHSHAVDSTIALANATYLVVSNTASLSAERALVAGAGLTSTDGGANGSFTLAVGAGNGITVNANDVALTTPGTLTVSSSNSASGNHTHAITSSSDPGASASILASTSAGYLELVRLGLGVSPSYPIHARLTTEQMRLDYDATNFTSFTVNSTGDLKIEPNGSGGRVVDIDTRDSGTGGFFIVRNQFASTSSITTGAILDSEPNGTAADGFGGAFLFRLEDDGGTMRNAAYIGGSWTTAASASRLGRVSLVVYEQSTARTILLGSSTGSASSIGFLGAAPVARQTVTGSRGGNAALASALTALANLGLITDSSSA